MNQWVWSNGGMILTGENRNTRRKACPVPLCCACLLSKIIWINCTEKSPFSGANSSLACQEILSLYGTRSSISVLRKAPHWPLSWNKETTWLLFPNFVKIRFNNLFLFMPNVPCRFLNKVFVDFWHFTWPTDLSDNIWWRIQILKLLGMQSSTPSYHFLLLGSIHSPQQRILQPSQFVSLP
jgi:hypothetical protein